MNTRAWRTLTGSAAALAALMLFAAPASAQFEEDESFEDGAGYGVGEGGYRDYLGGYYNELGEEGGYSEDYTGYYEDEEEEEDDWF